MLDVPFIQCMVMRAASKTLSTTEGGPLLERPVAMINLTNTERKALVAVQDAFDSINSPSLTLSACYDYCEPGLAWDDFTKAVKGLCSLRLLQMEVISRTPRLYVTHAGMEVAA